MEALRDRQEAVTGWEVQRKGSDAMPMFVAIPPTARHYLHGVTPAATEEGKFAYVFLRRDVALATINAAAQVRGRES